MLKRRLELGKPWRRLLCFNFLLLLLLNHVWQLQLVVLLLVHLPFNELSAIPKFILKVLSHLLDSMLRVLVLELHWDLEVLLLEF